MSGFKTFDDGTVVVPSVPTLDAASAWHVEPEVAKPASDAAQAGGKKKKAQPEGDGKAGIPGAVFNLANAVSRRGGRRNARGSRSGGACCTTAARRSPNRRRRCTAHALRHPQIIGAGVGGMPYALKEAGFYRCERGGAGLRGGEPPPLSRPAPHRRQPGPCTPPPFPPPSPSPAAAFC